MFLQAAASAPVAVSGAPELRDIHVPADPSWWPPAPGWWLLALVLLATLVVLILFLRRALRRARARRRVLAELEACRLRYARDADAARLAAALHQLLRRVAREHDPAAVRQQGDAWRLTLARVPVDAQTLQQLVLLERAMYEAGAVFDAPPAVAAVRTWLGLALRPRQWKPAGAAHA